MNDLTMPGRIARLRATAYAKLTLTLEVRDRRSDGYHDVEGLVVSMSAPQDVIEVEAVPHPAGITLELEGDIEHVPTGSDNLAMRAGEALMLRAGRSAAGVRMTLRKKIPAGAGLGGGSADAAGAMHAVRRMLELNVDDATMLAVGAAMGSDVPFCLTGGAAWMRGRGEILEPVQLPTGLPFLIAIPPFRLATPTVYAAWDDLGGPKAERRVPVTGPVRAFQPELFNDLEAAAEAVEPRLAEFRNELERIVGVPAILAGSGSAYFVPVPEKVVERLDAVAAKVRRAMKIPVASSRTVARGVRLSVA